MTALNGTKASIARRNLSRTQDRQMWEEMHAEDLPMRYKMHCKDGTYNVRLGYTEDKGSLGLADEIREAKPVRIERLLFKEQSIEVVPENILMLAVEVDA